MKRTYMELLYFFAEAFAHISGGFVSVLDMEGRRLKTVDSQGNEVKELKGKIYPEAIQMLRKDCPEKFKVFKQGDIWLLPLDKYILAIDITERVKEENNLELEFIKALPAIASVVGGNAIIFDQDGIRKTGYEPSGRPCRGIGEYSEHCHQVMQKKQPLVGVSTLVEGALCVRMPVSNNFGLSINNEWSVTQKHRLLQKMRDSQVARYTFDDIVGVSDALSRCKNLAQKVASNDCAVLLQGESGTGKELFAQAIHNASVRYQKPFVAVNCAAIPPSLAESYFFGYLGGAFTGARKEGQEGVFEQANGGTIFLDEISEMELGLQAKLLRVLQEREVVRIGGRKSQPINIRVIASSNKDLKGMVNEGFFRNDLYYRLNVIEIVVPPLRERPADILPLTRYFLYRLNGRIGSSVESISPEAITCLLSYSWPGNVRELQNSIERAMSVAEDREIMPVHLPPEIGVGSFFEETIAFPQARPKNEDQKGGRSKREEAVLGRVIEATEKETIQTILRQVGNSRKKAAALMGISTVTLWRKMQRYHLV